MDHQLKRVMNSADYSYLNNQDTSSNIDSHQNSILDMDMDTSQDL